MYVSRQSTVNDSYQFCLPLSLSLYKVLFQPTYLRRYVCIPHKDIYYVHTYVYTPTAYRIRVAFPVKGPNRMSPNGGWKPRMPRASSWVSGGRLRETAKRTIKLHEDDMVSKMDVEMDTNSHVYIVPVGLYCGIRGILPMKNIVNVCMNAGTNRPFPRVVKRKFQHETSEVAPQDRLYCGRLIQYL